MALFKKKKPKAGLSKIIVTENSIGKFAEGYNRLRDNVMFLNSACGAKVIQIESSVANECKTTVSCNLAVSLGYAGKKVAVVEADFRRPNAHRLFGADGDKGIAEYVMGSVSIENAIKKTKYANVDVLPRGVEITNPSIVFISDKFKELIGYLRDNYDYVILDCAPVLQVSDYIHISKVSDGAILLVAYGVTSKYVVADAVAELKKNDVKLLGTVFTLYDRKKDYGYGYVSDDSYDFSDNAEVASQIDSEVKSDDNA